MNPTLDGIVEQAWANEEASGNAEDKDVEQEAAENTGDENVEAQDEKDEIAETEQNDADESDEDDDSGEEYTADDIEVESNEIEKEQKPTDGLSPEQSYIFNRLPDIQVRDKDGKSYTIKVPSQLPEDFEFANKREEVIFNQNVAAQELNARQLQQDFKTQEQSRQGAQFQETVNASIRQDVAELQKDGIFPKFKTPIDSPNFEKDPAAVEMQKVLDFMEERNNEYLKQSQNGAAFRFIGFKEAYDIYTAQEARKARNTAVNNEDSARKTIARKNSSSSGAVEENIMKPSVRSGTTTRDLLAEIEAMEF